MLTRENRLKMALELTRLVWDLKHGVRDRNDQESELILDVFEACYKKMELLETETLEQPIVPAD